MFKFYNLIFTSVINLSSRTFFWSYTTQNFVDHSNCIVFSFCSKSVLAPLESLLEAITVNIREFSCKRVHQSCLEKPEPQVCQVWFDTSDLDDSFWSGPANRVHLFQLFRAIFLKKLVFDTCWTSPNIQKVD